MNLRAGPAHHGLFFQRAKRGGPTIRSELKTSIQPVGLTMRIISNVRFFNFLVGFRFLTDLTTQGVS